LLTDTIAKQEKVAADKQSVRLYTGKDNISNIVNIATRVNDLKTIFKLKFNIIIALSMNFQVMLKKLSVQKRV